MNYDSFKSLPPEMLDIILSYHHCKDCYNKEILCMNCYLKCDCEFCKTSIEYSRKYNLFDVCEHIIHSDLECNCNKCMYLPYLYYHKIKST